MPNATWRTTPHPQREPPALHGICLALRLAMPLFVIDCAHGGDRIAGRSTPDGFVGYGGIREKDVTLALGQRLARALGADAVLTRDQDCNVSLSARARTAAQHRADALLSIHASHRPNAPAGARVWMHARGDRPSEALAEAVTREMARFGGGAPSAVGRGDLAVLNPSALPSTTAACMLEVDNLADPGAARRLGNPRELDEIAGALARALRTYASPSASWGQPVPPLPDDTAGGSITIRPGRGGGIDNFTIQVPNVGEFQVSPSDIRDWLTQRGYLRNPVVWSRVERDLFDAIRAGRARPPRPHPEWEGLGTYQWNDFSIRRNQPGLTTPQREAIDEEQAQKWGRMLRAWDLFKRQIDELAAATDGETIVRTIGHAITALVIIERSDYPPPFSEAFADWVGVSATASTLPSLPAAARAVVAAGRALLDQWHAAIERGNYNSYDLWPQHRAFVAACRAARRQIVTR
jgi:N-acetylmuramoyl-L-alanine amidase